mmetsp:Transcript_54846/g.158657  ORF Transcript_54846/g.158657 Transcript_54846/m.158657 type:complete len:415 (+) Transcript_54846:83-1327(+)
MARFFIADRGLLIAAAAVAAWVLTGTVFYWAIGNCSEVDRMNADGDVEKHVICPWRLSHAFYYSVQTGMSIGFGLLSESKKASELYSCFHILAGSSFIGGALSFFVALMLTKQSDFLTRSERRMIKACASLHADAYHGLEMNEIREIMIMHPQYANALIRKLHPDAAEASKLITEYQKAQDNDRRKVATDILHEACEKLECFKDGKVKLQDLREIDEDHAGMFRKLVRLLRRKSNFIRIFCAWVAWVTVGALFSCLADDNDAITSIYFAIAALSTAGIVATKTVAGDAHVIFVGFYCLIGVPLYAMMLGSFANLLTEHYIEKKTTQKLNENLTEAETAFLAHLAGTDGNDEVNLAEYTELQLLRLGIVDRDTLHQIKSQFSKMDNEAKGKVKMRDFVHAQHLRSLEAPGAAVQD